MDKSDYDDLDKFGKSNDECIHCGHSPTDKVSCTCEYTDDDGYCRACPKCFQTFSVG